MAPIKKKEPVSNPAKATSQKKTYEMSVRCQNCYGDTVFLIPFGIDFISWREEKETAWFGKPSTTSYLPGYIVGDDFVSVTCMHCGSSKLVN